MQQSIGELDLPGLANTNRFEVSRLIALGTINCSHDHNDNDNDAHSNLASLHNDAPI